MAEQSRAQSARRHFLGAGALSAAGAALAAPAWAEALVRQEAPVVVVSVDGTGDFGPNTPGTRTSGIQEALDAVNARGGGVVAMRPGVYLVDNVMPPPEEARKFDCGLCSVRLYDNITLRGEGMHQTIIRTAAKCNTNALLGWQTSRVCLEDLTVDGAGLNQGYGIAVFGLDQGKGTAFSEVCLRRVRVTAVGVSAIGIAGGQRVVLDQCVATNSKTGFELGSPSVDYWVLNCTAFGCSNSTLIFNPADKYNEAGNIRPRRLGGLYDGEGRAAGVAVWDSYEALLVGVTARRGVTTNLQLSGSGFPNIRTPVGGGLIESCLAEASVGSAAGRYGIGASQDGVRVVSCSVSGNENTGVWVAPGEGKQVGIHACTFRAGPEGVQRYAITAAGANVRLQALGNLHDGESDSFLGNPGALAIPGSCLADNTNYNPVGLLPAEPLPMPGNFALNPHACRVEVHVHSGVVTRVLKRDQAGRHAQVASGTNVSLRLEPGEAIALEYREPPQWSWFGL